MSDETFPAGYIRVKLPSQAYMSFSKQIQSRKSVYGILLFPILVFQNISLANSNACKCNDWSGPPLCSLHSLPSFCVQKASKVNHTVGLALSQKIMGSYSSLSRLSKFHTKGRKLHIPTDGNSKDFDELTPTDNDIKCGFSDVALESPSVCDSNSKPSTAGNREKVKKTCKNIWKCNFSKGWLLGKLWNVCQTTRDGFIFIYGLQSSTTIKQPHENSEISQFMLLCTSVLCTIVFVLSRAPSKWKYLK